MNRLKELRLEKGLLQSDVAKVINKSDRLVGFYENGKRDMSTETLAILADFFNVSIDYLLGKSDIRKSDEQIKQDFDFAYHKEAEGLTDEEIADAIRFYKQIRYGKKDNK